MESFYRSRAKQARKSAKTNTMLSWVYVAIAAVNVVAMVSALIAGKNSWWMNLIAAGLMVYCVIASRRTSAEFRKAAKSWDEAAESQSQIDALLKP
ncbi:hypothetical protein [Leucobacter sp. 1207-22]|uniref:hypothetical protein n=1 Tax=Leucobacter sp. 1207-22 TaxID=2604456 RepID=UPI004062A8F3